MRRGIFLAALLCWSVTAQAGDKILYGPVPAWVDPAPAAGPPTAAGDTPVHVLLSDEQVTLEKGRMTIYSSFAMRIQTPQGLAAGNLSFPWRPETQDFTVHRLAIRREGRLIDVLAAGQTFTVLRREQNLEAAVLDGLLTANIQPEGLQVGDVLEFAASVTSTDPVMAGHVESIGAMWSDMPASRARYRLRWQSDLPVRLRQAGSLPAPVRSKGEGYSIAEWSMRELTPEIAPAGAPARFHLGRRIEATDFASWAAAAALLAPLYRDAAVIPSDSPLRTEVERIRSESTDPKRRAAAALALVQDRIRYVALAMGQGGMVPAMVAETWSRRYGDCKAKTVLLLALLDALDIQAEPVAVSVMAGDGLDERLPMLSAFDHVLVRATIDGRGYWLDGTRQRDTDLDRLPVPPFGWGLPLKAEGAALVRLHISPLDRPATETMIAMDASAGLSIPVPTRIETVFRGDGAIAADLGMANLTGASRESALKDYWRRRFDFIDIDSTSARFDPASGEYRMTMEGKAKMDWSSGYYETDETGLGYDADFTREAGPHRDAPFAVAHPNYVRTVQTVRLPPGFGELPAGGKNDVNDTIAGIEYRRTVSLTGGVFRVERTERSVSREFPAAEAPAAQAALRELAKSAIYIKRPATYRGTEAELTQLMATEPADADALSHRGHLLMEHGRMNDAIKDFDRALALDPKHAAAFANRGIGRAWLQDYAGATSDLAAAEALSPRNAVVFRGRGIIAVQQQRYTEAITALTRSLDFDPRSAFAFGHRARAKRSSNDIDGALADAASAIELQPSWIDMYLMRASIFRSQGKVDAVRAEAGRLTLANAGNEHAFVAAANIYAVLGAADESRRAFDAALAIKPEPYIYLNRAEFLPGADRAARRADIDAALALDPQFVQALMMKARWQGEDGDRKAELAIYDRLLSKDGKNPEVLTARGIARTNLGMNAGGQADFAAARAAASHPGALNNICWSKAIAGVALEHALADCDAALAGQPGSPAFLDSKGLVLLRLGRIDEAIAVYDEALKASPGMAGSLYARGVAWARKGDLDRSTRDITAATGIDGRVADTFANYGVKP